MRRRQSGWMTAAALVATIGATGAGAQGWSSIRSYARGPAPDLQVGTASDEIRTGRRSGQLTRQQARALRREAGLIQALEARYAAGGLSDSERAELRARSAALHDRISNARLGIGRSPPAQ